MPLGDFNFLLLGIAVQPDNLHTVQQRPRHIQRVGGRYEHHLGKVIVQIQIMVVKRRILLGIQHFQQRRTRVAAPIRTELVNLVQEKQRVGHAGFFDVLNNLARHCSDISAAVSADFRLVAHAAQRRAHELAPRRPGNRPPERGFAHARCPDQA